jgi:hypothetical protein
MIVNYYIDLGLHSELELARLLLSNNFQVFNATRYDSCTSGHNKLNTLDEIERALVSTS